MPIIHAAVKLRTWSLWAAGAVYTAAGIAAWSATTTVSEGPVEPAELPDPPGWAAALLLGLVVVPTVHALLLRSGRPDLPRQFDDGGLVDLNHAPAAVIVQLLGLPEADAAQVIEARERIGGFSSAEEVIADTELAPALVDGVRERLLFLR